MYFIVVETACAIVFLVSQELWMMLMYFRVVCSHSAGLAYLSTSMSKKSFSKDNAIYGFSSCERVSMQCCFITTADRFKQNFMPARKQCCVKVMHITFVYVSYVLLPNLFAATQGCTFWVNLLPVCIHTYWSTTKSSLRVISIVHICTQRKRWVVYLLFFEVR